MECICCINANNSRLLYSKKECDLQVIFYHKLPTEMIRTIGEYLYQPHYIKIKYRKRIRNPEWNQYISEIVNYNGPYDYEDIDEFIMEDRELYNCSSCFIFNFIEFKKENPHIMPRLRNDINWFNNIITKKTKKTTFSEYYDIIDKFKLPTQYDMYFYRSYGVIVVENYEDVYQEEETNAMLQNKNVKKIIITEK